jgi:fumarate hydratase class II
MPEDRTHLIVRVCEEIIAGRLDAHFPISVYQGGSGELTNVNVNEVIANRAAALAPRPRAEGPIHPERHANLSHSDEDGFALAVHVAALEALEARLEPSVSRLRGALADLATSGASSAPGGEGPSRFAHWAAALDRARARLSLCRDHLRVLPLGLERAPRHPEFPPRLADKLSELTGLSFLPPSLAARTTFHEALAHSASALGVVGGALFEVASDVFWRSSGTCDAPGATWLGRNLGPIGTAIMVACEAHGHGAALGMAAAGGRFEVSAVSPLAFDQLVGSMSLLAEACDVFRSDCAEASAMP